MKPNNFLQASRHPKAQIKRGKGGTDDKTGDGRKSRKQKLSNSLFKVQTFNLAARCGFWEIFKCLSWMGPVDYG
ncbi:hypothetical protein V6N13_020437 [Hibiscus sabdariffa]